jgi:predicted nuclease of predicted toxin-antitoxin system
MKIVLDMNIPQGWKEFLESQGHKAIPWREIGNIRADDTEIMEWARQNQFIVFTHDLDFGSLLYSTNASKPSVIQLRMKHIVPSVAGNMVIEILNNLKKELESGSLVTIDPERHRIRLLPLRN